METSRLRDVLHDASGDRGEDYAWLDSLKGFLQLHLPFGCEQKLLSQAIAGLCRHPDIDHASGFLTGAGGLSKVDPHHAPLPLSNGNRHDVNREGSLSFFEEVLGELAILTGKTQAYFDIRKSALNPAETMQLPVAPEGSALSVPLKIDNHVVGALCISHPAPGAYGPRHKNLLTFFARLCEQVLGHNRILTRALKDGRNWENYFRTLSDRLDLAITVMKTDHTVTFGRSNKTLGDSHPCRPVTGQKCRRLVEGHHRPCSPCPGEQALESGRAEMLDVVTEDITGRRLITRLRAFPVLDAGGIPGGFIQTAEALSTRCSEVKTFKHLAYFDHLTDLPNRTLFLDRLKQAQAQAKRDKNLLALLILDLDRFKGINDSFNHSCGDRLLKAVAKRLKKTVRQTDTVARLGSDEFAVMLTALKSESQVTTITRKIQDCLKEPYLLNSRDVFISVSIGIGIAPMDGEDSDTLLKHAGMALKVAKIRSPGSFTFFSADMNKNATERGQLESHMRRALGSEEFFLVYQPQVDHLSKKVIGVEALLRWHHPDKGLIPPSTFIPLAEETGFIQLLGEWALRQACLQNRAWQKAGYAPLPVSVNLSSSQVKNPELLPLIDAILTETGLDTRYLELELTESVLMEDAEATIATLGELKSRGIRLAIDDFGTGYSSLSYLKNLPIDRIKIDQTFVNDIATDPNGAPIVEAIIAMARSLRLGIIAEGVENETQLAFLRERDCREMQGFYFGEPREAEHFTSYFAATSDHSA